MKAQKLPNGNLLVPSMEMVNGVMVIGVKEVPPGSEEYLEWTTLSHR